ncbi:LAMI_0D09450g1_1 [Lachancea mirantina]|uniref:SWI5-dependent HO expression protein 3 n=1 Tax=Lachancea mirantina TaxID=1230905 RepID=A0A1G4JEA3_9SACH|nr:LAMI_0D09450g1_1 [Lachancea mirantina]
METNLHSPARLTPSHMSPSRLSPSRMSINQSTFLANMNNDDSPSRNYASDIGAGMSSSKVIETLHAQIDKLSQANLELTMQSSNLLTRLETSNQRQAQQIETISTLKHENENLGSVLGRKERKIKELESQLGRLRVSYEAAVSQNEALQQSLENSDRKGGTLEVQMQQTQAQYDALLDSHKRYRNSYETDISDLRQSLEQYKVDAERHFTLKLEKLTQVNSELQTKLHKYSLQYKELENARQEQLQELSKKVDTLRDQLDLHAWERLYDESKDLTLKYSEQTGVPLSPEFFEEHDSQKLASSSIQKSRLSTTASSIPNGSSIPGQPQLRMSKVRNTSAGKRSSFYGSNISISRPQPSSTTMPPPSSPALPGVKRFSSVKSTPSPSTSRHPSDEPLGPVISGNAKDGVQRSNSITRVASKRNNSSRRKKSISHSRTPSNSSNVEN